MNDYALVADEKKQKLTLHTATCAHARIAAALGQPVVTMLGCEREPEGDEFVDVIRHTCLDVMANGHV